MKLIIDIPEQMYLNAKADLLCGGAILVDAIKNGIPYEERPQGEWIPVSERLPEKMGTYLVTLEYKEHGKGITTLWYHGKGIGWDLRVADVVIAWQLLPEPYMKGGAE